MVNPIKNLKGQKVKLPKGFKTEHDFLVNVTKKFADDLEADRQNRQEMLRDLEFASGKQWDAEVKRKRDTASKPTLTINRIPSFVNALIGNRRLSDQVARVLPDNGGTKTIAKVRQGIIRNIQKNSAAKRAYNKAFENCVMSGMGNFQVLLDFADDDVFEQDITIAPIPNALAVVWDHMAIDPTGADARHCFVLDTITKNDFKEAYPKIAATSFTSDERLTGALKEKGWLPDEGKGVVVASYWRMRRERRILGLFEKDVDGDGKPDTVVRDITEQIQGTKDFDFESLAGLVTGENGAPVIRASHRRFAEMYLLSGKSVLEGPYRLRIPRVPVFRVPGWEVHVGDKLHRFGLVRWLRDPQKLHNFWRSVVAEKLMRAPKAQFIAPDKSVKGYEKDYNNAHNSDKALLLYNAEEGEAPKEVRPVPIEAGLVQEATLSAQDMRDVTNIHEANLGAPSNEVSGAGIMARQRIGETGMVIYNDNMDDAIEECAKVINHLIPIVYDTPRVVKILGEDTDRIEAVRINDGNDDSPDITEGKYAISLVTGPSAATRRVEAAQSMQMFIQHMPEQATLVSDLLAEAQDWPMADRVAARLRKALPPGLISTDEMTQEMIAQAQAQAQQAQQEREIRLGQIQIEMEERQARAIASKARGIQAIALARQAIANAEKTGSEVGLKSEELDHIIESDQARQNLDLAKFLKDGNRELEGILSNE